MFLLPFVPDVNVKEFGCVIAMWHVHTSMSSSRRRAQVGPIEASSLLYLLYQREAETECCRAERISCRLVHDVTLQVKGTCVLMNTGVSYDGS